MTPTPHTSTLFPYTTLFRSSVSGTYTDRIREGRQDNALTYNNQLFQSWDRIVYNPRNRNSIDFNVNYKLDFKDENGNLIIAARSEEHTSELQSRPHLVCRLL